MTSKAEALGPSASFGAVRSARSREFNRAMGIEAEEEQQPITHLPVEDISLNPDNPRSELGDLTELAGSLRDHGQKTAISIMGRAAYLAASPDNEGALEPDTRYVVIEGNSRLAAAREAGLKTIKVMVDDEMGSDANQLLESALVANVHRRDLEHLDEAKALQQLLAVHKTQEALAARLHRSQGWVAQRLALLNLTPELQQRLVEGSESVDLLRRVGNQHPENQENRLEELKREREAVRAAKAAAALANKAAKAAKVAEAAKTAAPEAATDDQPPHTPPPSETASSAHYDVIVEREERSSHTAEPELPAARHGKGGTAPEVAAPSGAASPPVPWHDAAAVADLIMEQMPVDQQRRLVMRLQALQSAQRIAKT
ncbi:ParB/RepB/Spo0J family partition protein [Streptomyces sp. NPDC015130]|uniref:ParB/RepB/Spo0J family partition protein n=1 Tax=Streptomyces sp. NPDC015130 TaxID=3364940 RepID=UPI0036F91E43